MKKLLTILVLIMLIISFFQITSMFALYREKLQSDYSTLLGVWSIKINGTDISSGGQDLEFDISDGQVKYVASDYVQMGKIAPGSRAYFDIVIDPENTDVSIVYQIDLGTVATGSNATSTANIKLISAENYFKIDPTDEDEEKIVNETENIDTDVNTYVSVIPVDKITQGYKNYVRIYFEWVNVDTKDVTDSTLATTEGSKLSVPLRINLKQYTGEGIGNGS